MKYLTGGEILAIHSEIIDRTGGFHGLRDIGLFLSIIEKPEMSLGGRELFTTVWEKAGVYLESFVKHQIFIDGNKRTGVVTTARFLFLNGFDITANNEQLENFTMDIVNKKLNTKTVANWLKENSISI